MSCVEEVILRNAHVRGIDCLRRFLTPDFCWAAAEAILKIRKTKESPAAWIITGFYVGGAPETDGPPGAYFLYRALRQLGFDAKIITELYCAALFEGVVPDGDILPVGVETPEDSLINDIFRIQQKPNLLIAVERCGRNDEGTYRDMRGNDISPHTARLDTLFIHRPEGCVTIGIGDGGNEIGMGRFAGEIARTLPVTPCVVPVDYLVLATVSNWGAYGLIRCLEMLTGVTCMANVEEVSEFLSLIVSRGALDGISRRREPKVDGYDLARLREVLEDLRRCNDPGA